MARVIAVSNQKGGVGKTTTAVNLSAALASLGQKTLLIDVDPQGNASSGLGRPPRQNAMGVYDVLLGLETLEAVRLTDCAQGLDLVPANTELVGAEVELVSEAQRERRLRRALDTVRDGYDWVVIDCPPSLGLLTLNALVAADGVLIPLQAEYYAVEGLGELLRTIGAVRKQLNPDLVREGIVVTMTDRRNNLCQDVEAQARELFGGEVFQAVVPRNVRLGEAPSFGQPIVQYDPRSAGAQAYVALGRELLERQRRQAAREAS